MFLGYMLGCAGEQLQELRHDAVLAGRPRLARLGHCGDNGDVRSAHQQMRSAGVPSAMLDMLCRASVQACALALMLCKLMARYEGVQQGVDSNARQVSDPEQGRMR